MPVASVEAMPKLVHGLHVDDVMTSGATWEALVHTLKTAGACRRFEKRSA